MYFHLELKSVKEIFFLLDVVAESEDEKVIPSSILPVTGDLVSLEIIFW